MSEMLLDKCVVEQWNITPTEKGPKGVLLLAVPLTPTLAGALELGFAFRADGSVRTIVDGISVSLSFQDIILSLPNSGDGLDSFYPQIIHKLKIRKLNDEEMEIVFRAHFAKSEDIDSITDFILRVNKQEFAATLGSRQGELFEGGTRVDMAPEQDAAAAEEDEADPLEANELAECEMCDDGVPLDDSGRKHKTKKRGREVTVPCLRFRTPRAEPAISSMREMNELESAMQQ